MLNHYLRLLRRADRQWHESDASLDESNPTLLPPSLSLAVLALCVVAGIVVSYAVWGRHA